MQADIELEAIAAPVVIGTSKALARLIKKTRPSTRQAVLSGVSCVVCDEIDRLVTTLGRYATQKEVSLREARKCISCHPLDLSLASLTCSNNMCCTSEVTMGSAVDDAGIVALACQHA